MNENITEMQMLLREVVGHFSARLQDGCWPGRAAAVDKETSL